MRHSFCPFQAAAPQPPTQAAAGEAGVQTDCKAASQAPSADSQPSSNSSSYATPSTAESSRTRTKAGAAAAQLSEATNGLNHHNHSFGFGPNLHAAPAELSKASAKHAQRDAESAGPSSTAVHLRVSTGQHTSHPSMAAPAPASYASSTTSTTSADDLAEVQGCRGSGGGVSSSGQSTNSGWHPHDPEHLIVNGLGGAFLHPTHVFSPSRFVSGVLCCAILCPAPSFLAPPPPSPAPLSPHPHPFQPLAFCSTIKSLLQQTLPTPLPPPGKRGPDRLQMTSFKLCSERVNSTLKHCLNSIIGTPSVTLSMS